MIEIKLLCCTKIVGNFETSSTCGWEIEDNNVDLSFYPKQISCFDASCFELALECKLADPENICLSILSVSDGSDERFFRPLLALGADRCTIIKDDSDLRFAPSHVAYQISEYVKREPQDWLLFGNCQSLGQNGAAGILTASLLGLPCYTGVTEFSVTGRGLRITYRADEALLTRTAENGGVLVLDESVTNVLRTPTMMQVLAARSRPIEKEEAAEGESPAGEDPVLFSLEEEHTENHCEMLPPDGLARRFAELCRREN